MAVDFKSLASAVPGMNQQAQQRAQAANNVSLQQQLGAAPRQLQTRAASQQAGAAQTAASGQLALQQNQQQQQQLTQIGQMGLQQQQNANQAAIQQQALAQKQQLAQSQQAMEARLTEAEIASRKKITNEDIATKNRLSAVGLDYDERLSILSTQQRKDLNRVGNDIQQKLFDARLSFEDDERGRKFSNQRQLADYTIMNAKSEQDFRAKAQSVSQASSRKMELLNAAYTKISKALDRSYKSEQGRLDFENQKKIAELKAAMYEAMQREKSRSANNMAMWRTGGRVVGTVVGLAAAGVILYASGGSAAPAAALAYGAGAKMGGDLGEGAGAAYGSAN